MEQKVQAGNSKFADSVYGYFTAKVIQKLDADAARS